MHQYGPGEYLFPDQILTLWDADEQNDHFGHEERAVWAQVGIGSEEYLEEIERIKGRARNRK